MRLKLFACAAALAAVGLSVCLAPTASAADPKSKTPPAKKKQAELNDKTIDKTLQWEDKVMGPDDKRAELDKIARAQAVNKAAAEKAEKERAAQEKQAAREAAQPKPQVKRNDVSLPSVEESKPEKKVEVVETPPPPPPPTVKPADDKFIDKLLKDEGGSRKKVSKGDDKELQQLLGSVAKEKPAPTKGKGKRGDSVDDLLKSADEGPAMPAPKTKPELPEWANKPDVSSTPARPPVAIIKPPPKKDDGVIHVVQGMAGTSSPPPARPAPVMTPPPAPAPRRQIASSKSGGAWNDPFADSGSSGGATRKSAPARESSSDPFADDAPAQRRAAAPASRREPARAPAAAPAASTWNDPFADGPSSDKRPAKRAAAPAPAPKVKAEPAARPAAWKDPFTEAPAPSRGAVAMRDSSAAPRTQTAAAAAPAESHASSRWGVIKKRR